MMGTKTIYYRMFLNLFYVHHLLNVLGQMLEKTLQMNILMAE